MSVIEKGRRISTGVLGLDEILGGGLTPDRIYLLQGEPGAGKTTMALQFLMDGARQGLRSLYITLSETAHELKSAADSHGWSLDGIDIYEIIDMAGLDSEDEQSILHPADIELGETSRKVMERVSAYKPARVVFDSLSEMRLLAQNPLRYRRQILALKYFFSSVNCTVLLLDDQTSDAGDLHVHSTCHGVIRIDQQVQDFGPQHRRLQIVKMRGIKFRGGYHDFSLDTGGIEVFPRLVASEHWRDFSAEKMTTGSEGLDSLLGGGLTPGTNVLLVGPAGVGKTTTAVRCLLTALDRGEPCAYYLFDEGLNTLIARATALGMDIRPHIDSGLLTLSHIDPAELSAGEFAARVRASVEEKGAKFVIIDSLHAYLQAMPGEKFLLLQMHELLTYLNQQGVLTVLILGQHGVVGDMRSDVDLSYLSDTILLFRFFEVKGEVLKAIAVIKSRTSAHERTIREFRLTADGIEVGEPLTDFEGVLGGLPTYTGEIPMLSAADGS